MDPLRPEPGIGAPKDADGDIAISADLSGAVAGALALRPLGFEPAQRTPTPRSADGDAFGVYVHWPFCTAKCPYCDFNSHVRHGGVDEAAFRDAICTELRSTAEITAKRRVDSVFFGGGTPSLMSPGTVGAILETIADLWEMSPTAEITLEANPTSVEADRFRGYRTAGVNRVSLGVQALNDRDLQALGRMHTVAEARAAVALAQATFDRMSFDLIYARTNQTVPQWRAELADALAMAGDHLSLYQLTIEPDTPFEKLHTAGKLAIPDADLADALYDLTREQTAAAGLPIYEISNHARPGAESRHNLIYWRYQDYIGVGPGAHGRPVAQGQTFASSTLKSPEAWLAAVQSTGHGLVTLEPLDRSDVADELLLMGLRLTEGVDLARLEQLTGATLGPTALADLEADGFVARIGNTRLKATDKGRFLLNRLVLMLSDDLVFSKPS